MSDTQLATLATYVPTPIAYQIAATPQIILQPQSHQFEAAVVFVDLCGFTALADQLGEPGSSGVEELTHILNGYFERIITLLELYGGQVVKFSGDALLVLFSAHAPLLNEPANRTLQEATLRAVQAGQTMRTALTTLSGSLQTEGLASLKLKVSIAAGHVLAMQVGGVFGRWEYVIAGDALVQLAIAAQHTAPNQVVLSDAARRITATCLESTPTSGGCWLITNAPPAIPRPLAPIDWSSLSPALYQTAEAALRAYIPAAVTYRLNGGGGWLAEVRTMSVLFAGISGLDYSAPDAPRWLQRFVTAAQEAVYRYEGALNKVAVDDKGTVLLALFGTPPLVHGDDPARAVACAHDLQMIAHQQRLRMAIGITTGTVFAGTVGALGRREYTVIGDRVNTAARLMQIAGSGGILSDEATARSASESWTSTPLPPVRLKGKSQPVTIYQPELTQRSRSITLAQPIFGREPELTQVLQALIAVQRGNMRLLVVTGEAGSGKTRLVQEVQRLFQHCDVTTLSGGVRFDQRRLQYRAWIDMIGSIFQVQTMTDGVRRIQVIADRARALYPQLRDRLPLLNDIQNLGLPESDVTASLNQTERHRALSRLLAEILRERAHHGPCALLLEDIHRADPLSWSLLLDLVSQLRAEPLLILLTMRPLEHLDGLQIPALTTLLDFPESEEVQLGGLLRKAAAELARCHLGLHTPPDELIDRLMATTGGNPASIERAFRELPDPRYGISERTVG